ncbi:MAG: succinyl-diaminopimelate desuccinylase [Gammaproteobacteria bacterium]
MSNSASPVIALAQQLIRLPSITPHDEGCQRILCERLATLGFQIEAMRFGDVDNFYAVHGNAGPVLCFAGHTDVVPTGPTERWGVPPFDGTVQDGVLHGRGAADMKGALAAMICATEAFIARRPAHPGRLAFLITSDEEGPSVDGTRRVVETLRARGETLDYCVIGEPSSDKALGDRVRHGRRGSLNARLTIKGVQGHVAYPQLARNPIHDAAPLLHALATEAWDEGNADFPPTTLQISNINAGTGAGNVIPGELTADFNLRFSTELTQARIEQRVAQLLNDHDADAVIEWKLSGAPFLSEHGALRDATLAAIADVTGRTAECSTSGGTSDGRFICDICPELVELGTVGRTIHQIDEQVTVHELEQLEQVYVRVMERLLS